ncbi:MAG: Tad domain-containing protein [Acidobacteria bacterium]|nr:Tad domain-containing protein [Acidobacteriota bacterium]
MILVQVFLLILGFCALAALTVDLGYVTLTRVQMQNAVDAAALEGLRYRDDPTLSAEEKRARAAEFANGFFADNGTATTGAGPVIGMSAGVSDLNALQTIESLGYYKPALKANADNEPGGDVVTGSFEAGQPGLEDAAYKRDDFTNAGDRALLVRMRRSNEAFDDVTRSGGPALPFFFGRVTTMQPNAGGYNPRMDGITVRATAIAEARPVRQVRYAADPASGRPGVIGVGLLLATWLSMAPGDTIQAFGNSGNGLLYTSPAFTGELGRYLDPASALAIGNPLSASSQPVPQSGYLAIYFNLDGIARVVGYGRVFYTPGAGGGPDTITREAAQDGTVNTNSRTPPPPPDLTSADWNTILAAHQQLYPASPAATALVRATLVR